LLEALVYPVGIDELIGAFMSLPGSEFSFTIKFARGQGDPRRIFDAASSLIDGFEGLDATVCGVIDSHVRSTLVVNDIQAGSIRVILSSILENLDDDALKSGDFKRVIGHALVKAKYKALEYLNKDKENARRGLSELRDNLTSLAAQTDAKYLPAYAPIHEGRLIGSLDKIQDAKRALLPKDKLTVETDGRVYEVDLSESWDVSEAVPIAETKEKHSEGVLILTIRKPDLLGGARWQFAHGKQPLWASIEDERWLKKLHERKVSLYSGDALQCKVRFTYVFDAKGQVIEQKTDILRVMRVIQGSGAQLPLFEET
jgi:hypothetical protein